MAVHSPTIEKAQPGSNHVCIGPTVSRTIPEAQSASPASTQFHPNSARKLHGMHAPNTYCGDWHVLLPVTLPITSTENQSDAIKMIPAVTERGT